MDHLELEKVLFAAAATGSAEAFYDLAEIATANYLAGIPEALGGAEILMRLAAAANPTYRIGLAGFLLCRGTGLKQEGLHERGEILRWEAIEILRAVVAEGDPEGLSLLVLSLEDLADSGDEMAAVELNKLIASLPRNIADEVRAKATEQLESAGASPRPEGK